MIDPPAVKLAVDQRRADLAHETLQAVGQERSDPKGNMGREWSLVRERVAKDRAEARWDSAIRTLEDFAVQYPDIRQDREYERELAMLKALQAEADSIFKRDMREAQKLFSQGKVGQALTRADKTWMYYPERKDLGKSFLLGGLLLLLISVLVYILWSSHSARKAPGKGIVETPKPDQPG